MNRDDVLRMAREAAAFGRYHGNPIKEDSVELSFAAIERFAALVAASEREACAKVCEERADRHADDAQYEDTEDLRFRSLVYAKHVRRCAEAIRARAGDQP
jgi:hypothetical protein